MICERELSLNIGQHLLLCCCFSKEEGDETAALVEQFKDIVKETEHRANALIPGREHLMEQLAYGVEILWKKNLTCCRK